MQAQSDKFRYGCQYNEKLENANSFKHLEFIFKFFSILNIILKNYFMDANLAYQIK
jgi:hypothetical protein